MTSGGQHVPESEPTDMITVNLATTLKMGDFCPHTIKEATQMAMPMSHGW